MHRGRALPLLALAGALTGGACVPVPEEPPPPITGLDPGAWTWVGFPDSACDDGSPTGIGVSPGTEPDLVVFLNGGGACWDYVTCFVLGTTSHGPFGEAEFEALARSALPGSILDRNLPGNPYRQATLVFVPYCTGDIHGGDNVAVYAGPERSRAVHHVGHANVLAFLRRLKATYPSPRRLVVVGASAGGFGALVNYDDFRRAWPEAEAVLVDDSGPPLGEGAVSPTLLEAWFTSWRLDKVLDPLCGPECRRDLSASLVAVARKYPGDRLALLSSLQDEVISGYYLVPGPRLEEELLRLAQEVMDPTPNARYFYVAGRTHTMIGDPAGFSQGVPLLDWLTAHLAGEASWNSQLP